MVLNGENWHPPATTYGSNNSPQLTNALLIYLYWNCIPLTQDALVLLWLLPFLHAKAFSIKKYSASISTVVLQ